MSAPVQIGDVLAGKYRIEKILGRGGMGVVAAAIHVQLDERVAIKFLLPEALQNDGIIERFNREAKAQIKIKSEHVARTIDVGTLDNGAPFIVMEYLHGTDLQQRLDREKQLPVEKAVDSVLQACEALAEAHAMGIIHRDLKPANLFVTRRADGTDCVKVLDFGISKFTDPSISGDQDLTQTAATLGSPLYMSPEQLRSSKRIDARSDIWALGVIVFELVAGDVPFKGDSIGQLCVAVLGNRLPKLSEYRVDVPPGLQEVLERATAKDPSGRYAHIADFAAALCRFGTAEAARSTRRIQRVLEGAGMLAEHSTATTLRPHGLGAAPGAQTFNGLGTTSTSPTRRPLLVGGVMGAVLVAAGVAFFLLASSTKTTVEPADAPESAPELNAAPDAKPAAPTRGRDVEPSAPARDVSPEPSEIGTTPSPSRPVAHVAAAPHPTATAKPAPKASAPSPAPLPTTAPAPKPVVQRPAPLPGKTTPPQKSTQKSTRKVDLYGSRE